MYDVGNPCPGLGHTQQYAMVKLVNGIPNRSRWNTSMNNTSFEIFDLFHAF
jgi:hypothetical protein